MKPTFTPQPSETTAPMTPATEVPTVETAVEQPVESQATPVETPVQTIENTEENKSLIERLMAGIRKL